MLDLRIDRIEVDRGWALLFCTEAGSRYGVLIGVPAGRAPDARLVFRYDDETCVELAGPRPAVRLIFLP